MPTSPGTKVPASRDKHPNGHIGATGNGFAKVIQGRAEPVTAPKSQAGELRALLRLRETAARLLDAEAATPVDTPQISQLRAELNDRYDGYVAGFGPLNRFTLRRTGRADPVSGDEKMARVRPPQGGSGTTRSPRWWSSTRSASGAPRLRSSPSASSLPAHPGLARTRRRTHWRSAWIPEASRACPRSPACSAPTLPVEQMQFRAPGRPWLIPVRFAPCDVPDLYLGAGRTLGSLQRVDQFDGSWESGIPRLLRVVIGVLDTREALPKARALAFAGRGCGDFVGILESRSAAEAIKIALFLLFMQVRGLCFVRRRSGQGQDRTADLPLFRPCTMLGKPEHRSVDGARQT